jgi:hypothetical protein
LRAAADVSLPAGTVDAVDAVELDQAVPPVRVEGGSDLDHRLEHGEVVAGLRPGQLTGGYHAAAAVSYSV